MFSVASLSIVDTQALREHSAALVKLADAVTAAAHEIAGEKSAERRQEELLEELHRPRTST